jgi:hypothetical protein
MLQKTLAPLSCGRPAAREGEFDRIREYIEWNPWLGEQPEDYPWSGATSVGSGHAA